MPFLPSKIKKFFFPFIILTVASMISPFYGCIPELKGGLDDTREEIVDFDTRYWGIADEFEYRRAGYYKELDSIPPIMEPDSFDVETYSDNIVANIISARSSLEVWNKILKDYTDYTIAFTSLYIPEPLDAFYIKKIKQLEMFKIGIQKNTAAVENGLLYFENIKYISEQRQNGVKPDYQAITDIVEERNRLFLESDECLRSGRDLSIEAEKIRKEVYEQYELENLLEKWKG